MKPYMHSTFYVKAFSPLTKKMFVSTYDELLKENNLKIAKPCIINTNIPQISFSGLTEQGSVTISSLPTAINIKEGAILEISLSINGTITKIQGVFRDNCIRIYPEEATIHSTMTFAPGWARDPERKNAFYCHKKSYYIDIIKTSDTSLLINYNLPSNITYILTSVNSIYDIKDKTTLTRDKEQYVMKKHTEDFLIDYNNLSKIMVVTINRRDYLLAEVSGKAFRIYDSYMNKVQEFPFNYMPYILNLGTALLLTYNGNLYYSFDMNTWNKATGSFSDGFKIGQIHKRYENQTFTKGGSCSLLVLHNDYPFDCGITKDPEHMGMGKLTIYDNTKKVTLSCPTTSDFVNNEIPEDSLGYDSASYNYNNCFTFKLSEQEGDLYYKAIFILRDNGNDLQEYIYENGVQHNVNTEDLHTLDDCLVHDFESGEDYLVIGHGFYNRSTKTYRYPIRIINASPESTSMDGSIIETKLTTGDFISKSIKDKIIIIDNFVNSSDYGYIYYNGETIRFVETGQHSLPIYFDSKYYIIGPTGRIREYTFVDRPSPAANYVDTNTVFSYPTALKVNGHLLIASKDYLHILEKDNTGLSSMVKVAFPKAFSSPPIIYYSHGKYVFTNGKDICVSTDLRTFTSYTSTYDTDNKTACFNGIWIVGGVFKNLNSTNLILPYDYSKQLKEKTDL